MAYCNSATPRESYALPNTRGDPSGSLLVFGAGTRTRTADLRFTKPLLYQLSYTGVVQKDAHYSLLSRMRQGQEGFSRGELSGTRAGRRIS